MKFRFAECQAISRNKCVTNIGFVKFRRVYDEVGNVIETREHVGDFKEWQRDQNVCHYPAIRKRMC